MPTRKRALLVLAAAAALSACDAVLPDHDAVFDPTIECEGGECVCREDLKDCDGEPLNGCEVDLRRSESCGECGHDCLGGPCGEIDGERACLPSIAHASSTFNWQLFAVAEDGRLFLADAKQGIVALRPGDLFTTPATSWKGRGWSPLIHKGKLLYCVFKTGGTIFETDVPPEGAVDLPDPLVVAQSVELDQAFLLGASDRYVHALGGDHLYLVSRDDHTVTSLGSLSEGMAGYGSGGGRVFWILGSTLYTIGDDGVKVMVTDVSPMLASGGLDRFLMTDGHSVYATVVRTPEGQPTTTTLWEIQADTGTMAPVHEIVRQANGYPPFPRALDAQYIYLVTNDTKDTAVYRFSRAIAGEPPLMLVTAVGQPFQISVASNLLYWSNAIQRSDGAWIGGTLHRLVLPDDTALP